MAIAKLLVLSLYYCAVNNRYHRWKEVDVTQTDDIIQKKFRKEINSGTISLALLAIAAQSAEPLYGYQIARKLEDTSQEEVPIKQGTLYPILRSLESQGLLSSFTGPSDSGPSRRYYAITDLGKEALTSWKDIWIKTRNFVDAALEETHE